MDIATQPPLNRRRFLASHGLGLGSVALAWMLKQDALLAEPIRPELKKLTFDLLPRPTHRAPRADAMISLFMQGGPSHLDLFDPKPQMAKFDGKNFPEKIKYDNAAQASPKVLHSPWKFHPRGECGTQISELLPHISGVADDLTLIRSMHTGVNNHGQSIYAMNTGRVLPGRPTLGSWLTYGLGCESNELPAYVAMTDPKGLPVIGVNNWSNGWLPSLYQGTVIRPKSPRILNLNAPQHLAGQAQTNFLDYLKRMNREHLGQRPGELDLEARIASYELAARMQSAAGDALDVSRETRATHRLYGLDDPQTQEYGTRCLIARRLVERGVRFVQLFTKNQYWDHHGSIRSALPAACLKTDKGSAALIIDLKQRGMLDRTVVHWGGEMGRLPVIQNDSGPAKIGRDHNTYGFSMWMAGGGFRAGLAYGATDDFGHRAVENVVNHYDYHATLLRLFGLDPHKLVYARNGQQQSLLDGQPGRVVGDLLEST